jgi:hypothetical protein
MAAAPAAPRGPDGRVAARPGGAAPAGGGGRMVCFLLGLCPPGLDSLSNDR